MPSRGPRREAELTATLAYVDAAGQNNDSQALEDVLWTMLNIARSSCSIISCGQAV